MQITLTNTGKRYNREWIFRHLDLLFEPGRTYAITGPNGSGKSTLLQVIAGSVLHSEGSIDYKKTTVPGIPETAPETLAYRHLSIATPYLELIEEMTAKEMLEFHERFKDLTLPPEEVLELTGLGNAMNKQLRYFSSGMKQRMKLAQAFFSDTPVLLLDEPTTNLDKDGIALYLRLIRDHTRNRMVIISSNVNPEFDFCEQRIEISDYK
jgi:ABC-type multidrug transport system ATPase subunit